MNVANQWESAGRRLRERRRELKLTLTDLAGRIGCSYAFISDIERGEKRPSFGTAELFAQTLDLDLDEICCGFGIVPPEVAALVIRDKSTLEAVRGLLKG